MARTELELLISVIDQATSELRLIAGNIDKVDTAGKQADKGGLAKFTEGMMDVKASLDIAKQSLQAVGKMFEAVLDLARQAGQIERAERAFTNLSGSAEEAAANLEAMKQAAHGTLSEMDAMSSANKLMAMGLANNSEELDKVATMAIRLGQAFGRDATQAIDEFSLLLANQSVLRLDTFGISGAAVRKRIEELTASMKDMSREEAFMIATFEEGNKTLERLGDYVEDSATSVERLESSWADLKNEWIERVAPAAVNVSNALLVMLTRNKQLDAALEEHEAVMTKVAVSYDEYKKEMMRSLEVAGKLDQQVAMYGDSLEDQAYAAGMATEAQWWLNRALQDGDAALDSWQRRATESSEAAVELAGDFEGLTTETLYGIAALYAKAEASAADAEATRKDVEAEEARREAWEKTSAAIGGARGALREFGEESLRTMQLEQMLKMLEGTWDEQEVAIQRAGNTLAQMFLDGEISADEFMTRMGEVKAGGAEAMAFVTEHVLGLKAGVDEGTEAIEGLKQAMGEGLRPEVDVEPLDLALERADALERKLGILDDEPITPTVDTAEIDTAADNLARKLGLGEAAAAFDRTALADVFAEGIPEAQELSGLVLDLDTNIDTAEGSAQDLEAALNQIDLAPQIEQAGTFWDTLQTIANTPTTPQVNDWQIASALRQARELRDILNNLNYPAGGYGGYQQPPDHPYEP